MTTLLQLHNPRANTCAVVDQYSAADYAVTLYRGAVPQDRSIVHRCNFTTEEGAIAYAVICC